MQAWIRLKGSGIRDKASGIRYRASGIQYPVSSIQYPVFSIQYPVSGKMNLQLSYRIPELQVFLFDEGKCSCKYFITNRKAVNIDATGEM